MNKGISIREFSELKLENIRLHHELQAQKELYNRCLESFQKLLNETCSLYEPREKETPQIAENTSSIIINRLPNTCVTIIPPIIQGDETRIPRKRKTSNSVEKDLAPTSPKPARRRSEKVSKPTESSSCIQEVVKKSPRVSQPPSFTESALRRSFITNFQRSNIEEYIYLTLRPYLTEENVEIMYQAFLSAMFHSLSLLKEYDAYGMIQRGNLYSSLLNFIVTRFEAGNLVEKCFVSIEMELNKEIFQKHVNSKQERFSPAFVSILLVYHDLCRIYQQESKMKQIIYSIFRKAGEFPIHVIYILWKYDNDIFAETTLFDAIINGIIGITLQTNLNDLQSYYELTEYYDEKGVNWEQKLVDIETNALQCVINHDGFTDQTMEMYAIAGKGIALLYVYHGANYAIQSLLENCLIERIESEKTDVRYRLLLVYIILWSADSGLFGGEWLRIKEKIDSLGIITDNMRIEFSSLFV